MKGHERDVGPPRDDLGAAVPLAGPPRRVVSLVPSLTEALAVTVPDRLVGATDWCSHPAGLDVARVRGTKNPDRAAIAALAPDLVVANRQEADRAGLQALGGVLAITDSAGAEVRAGDVHVAGATTPGPAAVDTTGAGDAFAAGLLAGLLDAAWPPDEAHLQGAAEAGVALASAVARVRGAQARVPGEREARLFA